MEIFDLILKYIIIPLFIWIWLADRKLVKLESQQITKHDLDLLYISIRELGEKIENRFISVESCNFRHK